MFGVLRAEKRALVVVKPPGDPGRGGILEVDDCVLIAVKIRFVKKCARAMHQSGELEIGVGANALAVKAGKQGCRSGPVEALAVKKDPDSQKILCLLSFPDAIDKATRNDIPALVLSRNPVCLCMNTTISAAQIRRYDCGARLL